jgi:hypothetical protein
VQNDTKFKQAVFGSFAFAGLLALVYGTGTGNSARLNSDSVGSA